ncbi:MAG: hypothetical protein A2140_01985 [Candidatus Muproteobacteria bacterium RBG_16_62_13]|uniref:Uncharacterized protein n=1 Tax=Candidatus Muproteobacteria bacterium RBG_16_62_13 TaxID=1817756 RepID=A0A1F6T6W6_9PROT|nr:MAG: hypothetical protein A2140_01985 [Candidatus Muproteobacteria bacterium RBG_16_62_13]
MRKILTLLVAIATLGAGNLSWAKDDAYPGDIAVIELGHKGDVTALQRLRKTYLPRATKKERFAIFVASRIASPSEFTNEFVANLPAKRGDVWFDLTGYEHAWTYSEFFVADQLREIAATGHKEAISKLIEMGTWVGGGWAMIIHSGIVRCLIRHPDATLTELAKRSEGERSRLLETTFALSLLDEDVEPLLLSVRQATVTSSNIRSQIERLVSAEMSGRKKKP